MIIDFKMKAPIPAWEVLFEAGKTPVIEKFKALENVGLVQARSLDDVIGEMDGHGITHSVILGRNNEPGSSNAELLEFLSSQKGERFFGFIGIEDMTVEESVETIYKYAATGKFHGVAANPAKIRPLMGIGDPSLDPIFEACLEHDLPFCMTLSLLISLTSEKPDYDYIHPRQLIRVAEKYPGLKLIISHAAWPFVQESIAVAIHYPNIYLCPDFYISFPGGWQYAEAAERGLEDQLIYASCYPNVPYDYAMEYYRKHDLPEDIIEKVMSGNAKRILGID
ncbi:amidohydrolase family protein [Salinicoccus carnicancri]|uniref:amidohydrolase family protein n=1 Tax=Salinicoccus carnicancri TaxID=558170 RepID=UPI0002E70C85|nr:amidohydrolase family protein [Salinicoccus carnicancri]